MILFDIPDIPPVRAKRFAVSAPIRMKFSVNWLREFVDLPKNPEEIAELLTRAGVETENIETRGAKIDQVIVSQITASSRHPNADRLTVCEVDDGSGTKRQIVCGATNYKVGDKVPLALPGAKLPNGTEDSQKQTARCRIGRNALQPNRARPRLGRGRSFDFVA